MYLFIMTCLLVAATPFEIAPFLDHYKKGSLSLPGDLSIDVLISGIGLTATTWSLTRQMYIKRPDFIVQAGIAGCFDPQIALGTVVAIKQELIADQGVVEQGRLKTLFDLGLVKPGRYPFSKGWLVNKSDILKKIKLKKVNGISVNEITSSAKKKIFYTEAFAPITESMEGAALHYVCLLEKIPFLQLRSVSNYIGERNKKNWMLKESITNLNKELIHLLQQL
jgi:futalosine hydrolase